jgi:ABC-type multidrug transport system fused ATPase/permease subunit
MAHDPPYPYPLPLVPPVGEAVSTCYRVLTFILGIALIVTTYTYMLSWTYTGEVNAKRIREQYLKAILRQDIAYFDKVRPNFSNRVHVS